MDFGVLAIALVALAAGAAAGWILNARMGRNSVRKAEERAKDIVARAEASAKALAMEYERTDLMIRARDYGSIPTSCCLTLMPGRSTGLSPMIPRWRRDVGKGATPPP